MNVGEFFLGSEWIVSGRPFAYNLDRGDRYDGKR